ncbi:DsbA family oxidoreductase [Microbulbifer magnicolonia]|uniref:DsbA family oxidoreductase n=1 Tax=Microbulbifer magnicolonia TaxID=3109744 RepID=UPI002B4080E1|nr:DsbA family oxidoreductase [Microbulbifer sp. GG15]
MPVLRIDIYFELICPWCLIGKRNLEAALQILARLCPDVRTELRWQPLQLLAEIPAQGLPFTEFYERRLGGPDAVRLRQAQVRRAAASAGLEIAFERIAVMPNTARAHHLLAVAEQHGGAAQHADLLERLFCAYFQQGKNIGDPVALLELARRIGIDAASSERAMATAAPLPRSMSLYAAQGVPCFVFDNRSAIAGAVDPDTLVAAMRKALAVSADTRCEESPV